MIFFLIRGHPRNFIGSLAVDDLAIRSLNEAVFVHMGVKSQRTDKTNIRTLGRLDWTHAGIVRVVDVADGRWHVGAAAGTGLVTRKAARAKCGQTTLVGKAGKRVRLIHKLGQLRRAEKFLDSGHDGANVNQRIGSDIIGILRSHALANHALHTAHADTELILH